MSESEIDSVRKLLARCSKADQEVIFRELRKSHSIHEFEEIMGAPAEMILEAVHRAPELTRRMLRGVIADAAFRTSVVPELERAGWRDVTPEGNFAYDYKLEDSHGGVTIQVKLQRSERGAPVVRDGRRFGYDGEVFIVETQKTRTGSSGDGERTRPYRFGEFDILAVAMQPSSGRWETFMYTVARWLLPTGNGDQLATLQPVAKQPDKFWTNDFRTAAAWLRGNDHGKSMGV